MNRTQPISHSCSVCQTVLAIGTCPQCQGSGLATRWGLFRTDCRRCSGSGQAFCCPHEAEHWKVQLRRADAMGADALEPSSSPHLATTPTEFARGSGSSYEMGSRIWHPNPSAPRES